MASTWNYDVIPMSHDIINSWSGPQRKHTQTSYMNSKFNIHGVCYRGRPDRPAQSENEYTHRTYILTVFYLWFSICTGIFLKFHFWDWDLAENQAGKWDLDKIWAGKWDLYPPFRTLHSDSYAQVGMVKHPTEGLDLNASAPFLTLACSWHLRNPPPPPPPLYVEIPRLFPQKQVQGVIRSWQLRKIGK